MLMQSIGVIGETPGTLDTVADKLLLGENLSSSFDRSVLIGFNLNLTESFGQGPSPPIPQFVIGFGDDRGIGIVAYRFGNGVRSSNPASAVFSSTDGLGTDQRGADILIEPGSGTGLGAGGSFSVSLTRQGVASGDALNDRMLAMIVRADTVGPHVIMSAAPLIHSAGLGAGQLEITYDEANSKLRFNVGDQFGAVKSAELNLI